MAGAPKGNQNAAKTKVWSEAIRKAIVQDRTALDRLAKSLIAAAEQGDMAAIKEIGDRLDGKSVQATEISGPEGGPIRHFLDVVNSLPDPKKK